MKVERINIDQIRLRRAEWNTSNLHIVSKKNRCEITLCQVLLWYPQKTNRTCVLRSLNIVQVWWGDDLKVRSELKWIFALICWDLQATIRPSLPCDAQVASQHGDFIGTSQSDQSRESGFPWRPGPTLKLQTCLRIPFTKWGNRARQNDAIFIKGRYRIS